MTEYAVQAAFVLDEALARCLREADGHPLTFQQRHYAHGGDQLDKRCRCAFGRLHGTWHEVFTIVRLAEIGLMKMEGTLVVVTPAGAAWLRAHPPPDDWRSG